MELGQDSHKGSLGTKLGRGAGRENPPGNGSSQSVRVPGQSRSSRHREPDPCGPLRLRWGCGLLPGLQAYGGLGGGPDRLANPFLLPESTFGPEFLPPNPPTPAHLGRRWGECRAPHLKDLWGGAENPQVSGERGPVPGRSKRGSRAWAEEVRREAPSSFPRG